MKEIYDAKKIDLLDIGSNDGSFINSCSRNGIDAYGVEPAENLAIACRKTGLKSKARIF